MTPLVLDLERAAAEPSLATPAVLGGKGSNLARLIKHGFPVPRGFVVTTRAYREAVLPRLPGLTTMHAIRQGIAGTTVPDDLREVVSGAWESLVGDQPTAPLAVRSSACDEDAEHHSFAGQQASFLGVVGLDDVLARIRDVWASLFGDEAALYRSQMSLEAVPPQMAVIVQRMVDADRAGVCFTVNPVSGAAGEMVVSAAWGLGETVVAGGDSDTFYLRKSDGALLRRDIVEKTTTLCAGDDGLARTPVSPRQTEAATLSTADLSRIANVCRRVEGDLKSPQDIEWAFETDGGLWLLQTRPITARPEEQSPSVWTNVNVGEALPGVGTPMTWSIIRGFSQRGFQSAFAALGLDVPPGYELVGSFFGRVYLNLTQFAGVVTQIPVLKPETVLAMAGGPQAEEIEGTYEKHSSRSFLARLPLTVPKIISSQITVPIMGRRWAQQFRSQRDSYYRKRLDRLDARGLAATLDELDDLFDRTGLVMLSASSNFLSSYAMTKLLLRRWGGEQAAQREIALMSGLTDLRSAEPGLELLRIAHYVRRFEQLERHIRNTAAADLADDFDQLLTLPGGRELRRRLHAFLAEYGGRAVKEAELATPRWREDPTFLFDVVQTYLAAPFLPDPDELAEERAGERRATTTSIRPHFRTGLGVVFRGVLGLTQDNARLREDLRSCVVDSLAMYRRLFVEVGQRLTAAGVLASSDDVFFLTYPELRQYLGGAAPVELPARVALRRAVFEAFSAMPDPPQTFLWRGGRIISTEPEHTGPRHVLQGLPGSPGRATGRARVIIDPRDDDAQVIPGEILVAPFTDVGWTPLFLAAGGVVMDRGGPLSHSSIVAREYGIPAAVNVKHASRLVKTGDIITVDGDNGCVYLTKSAG